MTPERESKRGLISAAVIACAVLVAGCVSPPVQEMSNARQAIAAAQEAGAGEVAAENLEQANRLLRSAEKKLQDKQFREARRAAVAAKLEALEALQRASGTDDGQ